MIASLPELLTPSDALVLMHQNRPLYIEAGHAIRSKVREGQFSFYCDVCMALNESEPDEDWNLRNGIRCKCCRFGGRERHMYRVLTQLTKAKHLKKRIIFEEVTPFKALLDRMLKGFTGSEYIDSKYRPGSTHAIFGRKVRHDDVCNIAYPTGSQDLVVSMDVLEHVPDLTRALNECNRVLKPGGYKVMTVPFYEEKSTLVRAKLGVNGVEHLLTPEYHGNPISNEGALVFSEPGVDLLNTIDECGFDVKLSLGADLAHGLMPDANKYPGAHCWNLVFVLCKRGN
jgi:SAM-dependent methyltransferase